MSSLQAYKILCFTGIVLMILPCFSVGLLSDYKICGDSECESHMSRVQAIRDHRGKDCRFLSFRRGDTIFVYHKLTGKREDLWAGTIDRKFGYFPKDAVQEEQVYATTEKVVETQKSDFICMDEYGYPIDSSHLDNNDDDDGDDDQKIQIQEPETTQTIKHTDDTNAESLLTSGDPSSESVQQPDGTSTEEDENKNADDIVATTHTEAQETPTAPSEQGGSPSSSWLGSSVTGWLGLGKEEQPSNLHEGEKKDEREETQSEASLTSSVTGWLGFGGQGKQDDAVNHREEDKETGASFTSTMTGWLGYGGKEKVESTKKQQHEKRETEDESEPKETFRSRRMSLDLEGSHLQEEEKEMGALDWLGNGLSSTFGFGNQESEPIEEEQEKPVSSSWLDIGVGDILGYGKHKSEVDGSTNSGFKETEKDVTLEQAIASDTVDISQSQAAQTEEEKTELDIQTLETKAAMKTIPEVEDSTISSSSSNVEEHGQFSQSETESNTLAPEDGFNNNNVRASDGSDGSSLPVDAAATLDQKYISHQTMLEEKSQAVGVISSMIDEEIAAETEDEHNTVGNEGVDQNREPGEKEIKTVSDDEDNLTQSDVDLGPDLYSVDSKGQSVVNIKDQLQSKTAEQLKEDGAKMTDRADNAEESTLVSLDTGASNGAYEHERSSAQTDVLHRESYTTQTDESAEQSQVETQQRRESESTNSEDASVTVHGVKTDADYLDAVSIIQTDGSNAEKELHHGEIVQNGEVHAVESSSQEILSPHTTNGSTLYENAFEDQSLSQDTIVDSIDRDTGSLETQVVEALKEEEQQEELKELEEIKEEEKQLAMEEEKQEADETKEEERQKEVYDLEKKQKQEDEKEEKHDEIEGVKEEQKWEEIEQLKKEEKQEEAGNLKEEERQKEIEEELVEKETHEVKVEELKDKEEKMVEVKEEEKQEELDKVEKEEKRKAGEVESKEEEQHDEVEELLEEKGNEVGEAKQEEKQEKTEELQVEQKQAKVVEFEEVKMQKEAEKQQQTTSLKEEEKQEEVQEIKVEEKQEESKEANDLKEKQKEEGEEKQVLASHSEVQKKNISKPESESSEETHDKNAMTEEEKTEKEKTKHENVGEPKEKKRETEEMQQVNDVEGKRREKEQEERLTCSNDLCHQATEDESVRNGNDNMTKEGPNSADEAIIQRDNRNDESGMKTSDDMERDRVGAEEREETSNDSEASEGEKYNIVLNATGNEDVYSSSGHVSDGKSLEDQIEQIEATSYTHSDEQLADENEVLLTHTPETKGHDHLAKHADLSDHDMLSEGHEGLQLVDSETSSTRISTDKLDTSTSDFEESQTEQTVRHVSHPIGSSVPPDDHNRVMVENDSAGAFGLFKNAFSFFGKTPVSRTKEPTESAPSLDTNPAETSEPQASLTPEQEPDSTTVSSQASVQDTHRDSPVSVPTQPPSRSMDVLPHLYAPKAETNVQTRSLSKHYKNLLSHVSVDEMTTLLDLFGRHKLQFLDYVLGSSEIVTDHPDNDESILSDIERLLHHHRNALVAPRTSLTDAPQEDKEKTIIVIALQKLEMLLGRLREAFDTKKSDTSKAKLQAEGSCGSATCSAHSKDKEESRKTQESSAAQHTKAVEKDNGQLGGVVEKARRNDNWEKGQKGIVDEHESPPHNQQGSLQPLEGEMKQILDLFHQLREDMITHAYAVRELLMWITVQVVSALPDDIRPGPDLYGVPWEPVIISSLVGLVTVLLFTCRCYSSVKSRMYRRKEHWMAEQVAQLLDEKCKVLETLSKCQQEYDDLEDSLRDSGILAQTQKTEQLEIKTRQVEHTTNELERDVGELKDQLEQQREHRLEQERRIAMLEESMKTLEDETKDLQSQEEQAQTTLKVYNMNSDRLQRNLETVAEEYTLIQESNVQLRQQAEGWAERVSELEAEMRRCEVAYSGMQQDVANKDERIMSLTDRLLGMKAWDSDLEDEERVEGGKKETSNGTGGKTEDSERGDVTDTQGHLQKVQKLIYAAKLNADLKSLDEDKDRVFAKLNDEVKAKEDLQESIKELENEKCSLQSDTEHYSDQVQRLQQKLQIMTEMYQENELKLHRLLTVEERERLQKEEKLNKADKNIALAIEEVNNYRQRAEEMEEELEKTKQSYQTQISAHEKKAHNNWLAVRAAERELSDIRRENALLRQKLTDTQFKLDAMDKDPYALDSLARPLPFRAERSPYGPSPLGRPASETRAFLSPPTLMDGPPARLSPRMSRGPLEPPGAQGEMDRSGGPHSDSGSISPTWERDRRGPPPGPLGPPGPVGPPGYMFPEPGGPIYRRPPPPPGVMGILPPPGSLPPGPLPPHPRGFPSAAPPGPSHPTDIADGPYRENSFGPGEQDPRESGPGDRRTPPEADPRMSGPPPPGPPLGPMDAPFPRRTPYGPPPPDFCPPRGPGGPPMRPMWAPPPPGMMFPPRFPPGGPSLPPAPHPRYAPPIRPSGPDRLPAPSMGPPPPQQSLSSPPHSQSQEEHATSPEDAI